MTAVTATDGRVVRGNRNRDAIIDALLACYEDGDLRPSVPDVAARAGVSVRSVHNHFADVEALRADASQRQWEKYSPLIGEVRSIDELVANRAIFFEAVTPVRRAGLLQAHDSPTIARNLARLDRVLRRQLEALFFQCSPEVLDALELVTSWDAWNRLRTAQNCTVAHSRRVVEQTIRTLIEVEGSAP